MNKKIFFTAFSAFLMISCSINIEPPKEESLQSNEQEITALKIDNLLRDTLALREGVEVIMSYLEMPKETTLPTHYHPGEEYVYMLHGSGELSLKDQSKVIVKSGDVVKVPLKQVHSFSTLDEGAKAVVFRVHEKGQPDRILIEDD